MELLKLPNEVLGVICQYLEISSALQLRQACKLFQKLIEVHLRFDIMIYPNDAYRIYHSYRGDQYVKTVGLSDIGENKASGLALWLRNLRQINVTLQTEMEDQSEKKVIEVIELIKDVQLPSSGFQAIFYTEYSKFGGVHSGFDEVVDYVNASPLNFEASLDLAISFDLDPLQIDLLQQLGPKFKDVRLLTRVSLVSRLSTAHPCHIRNLQIMHEEEDGEFSDIIHCVGAVHNYARWVPSIQLVGIKVQDKSTRYTIHKLAMTGVTLEKEGLTKYVCSANPTEIAVDSSKGFQSVVAAFNLSIITCLRVKITSTATFTESFVKYLVSILQKLEYCDLSFRGKDVYSLIFTGNIDKRWRILKLRLWLWDQELPDLPALEELVDLEKVEISVEPDVFSDYTSVPDIHEYGKMVASNCPKLTSVTSSMSHPKWSKNIAML